MRLLKAGDSIMQFGLRERLLVCGLTPVVAVLLNYASPIGEQFFWAVISLVGMAAFLLVKPSVPMKRRFQLIGLWELMAPVVLIVFATVDNPAELQQNALRLVFIVVFFVGVGTAARLIFWRSQ
jgi:uncharacterized membrane protein